MDVIHRQRTPGMIFLYYQHRGRSSGWFASDEITSNNKMTVMRTDHVMAREANVALNYLATESKRLHRFVTFDECVENLSKILDWCTVAALPKNVKAPPRLMIKRKEM
jgi:hypothetical protein